MNPIARLGIRLKAALTTPLAPPSSWNILGWIQESFAGAWQQNVVVRDETVAAYWAVFSCATLIAGDIAKLQPRVMQRQKDGTWTPTIQRPVLRKPNSFQTRAEFIACWVFSKLFFGNVYVLKEREGQQLQDGTRALSALYVLDPRKVLPLIAPDGSVFYQLGADNLAGIQDSVPAAPDTEIIHDKMYPIFHPLVGVSPIFACGIAAMQGAAILDTSAKFFQNMQRPSGILTAPGAISKATAEELKRKWDENFGSGNIGKTAVVGDNLKYQALTVNAVDAQLIEQLKMTGEIVAACFHVPPYKIGLGQMPTVANTAVLNQQYYDQCLQHLIETMEERLDLGLELPDGFETWFDLSGLLRMDPDTRQKSHSDAIRGGWKAPNEARLEENLPPVAGGDMPYMQQQQYPLGDLAARGPAPSATSGGAAPPATPDKAMVAKMLTLATGQLLERAAA